MTLTDFYKICSLLLVCSAISFATNYKEIDWLDRIAEYDQKQKNPFITRKRFETFNEDFQNRNEEEVKRMDELKHLLESISIFIKTTNERLEAMENKMDEHFAKFETEAIERFNTLEKKMDDNIKKADFTNRLAALCQLNGGDESSEENIFPSDYLKPTNPFIRNFLTNFKIDSEETHFDSSNLDHLVKVLNSTLNFFTNKDNHCNFEESTLDEMYNELNRFPDKWTLIQELARPEACFNDINSEIPEKDGSSHDLSIVDLPLQDLPSLWQLENGFLPGSSLIMSLHVPPFPERHTINFYAGPNTNDSIALHVDARFGKPEMVLNTFQNGDWQHEMRFKDFPLRRDKDYCVSITCKQSEIEVKYNGIVFARYEHRMEPSTIKTVELEGDVELRRIVYITEIL